MLISHKKEFIFAKTVRTASTSVESYFERYCLPEGKWKFSHARWQSIRDEGIIGYRGGESYIYSILNRISKNYWHPHMSAQKIRKKTGDEVWNNYFKFCVIRNPFDKLVSLFHQREKSINKLKRISRNIRSRNFNKVVEVAFPTTGSKVERFRYWVKNVIKGNIDRGIYTIDGSICMDYFIRFEDLENGVKQVCNNLDIPYEPSYLPNLKKSKRDKNITIREYYDSESIEIVKKRFEFEFREFGYDFTF